MGGVTWTEEQLAELQYLRVEQGLSWQRIAMKLRRSIEACKARHAIAEGRKVINTERKSEGGARFQASFEVPAYRRNDHEKHLRLILAALRKEKAA